MKCKYLMGQGDSMPPKGGLPVTVGNMVVHLIFADKANDEVPEIVGNILKSTYLHRQAI